MRSALATALLLLVAAPVPAAAQQPGHCAPPESTPIQPVPWAQQRLAPERVWPLTRGAGTIAVVDTGVSAAAPDLAGAVLPGVDVAAIGNLGTADTDCAGHGTFLAGLIAARPRERVGFAGMAPAATILPVRVTEDPSKVDPSRLAAGIAAAVDAGARVIAIGVLTTVDSPELHAAIDRARARDVVVVAPAAVRDDRQRAYPAALAGVVAVAPVGPDGPTGAKLGATPTVAGPAEKLVGIGPSGPGHRIASGPELAVAFAAATAGLVRARHPGLRAPDVVARITATADRPAGPSPNPVVGLGVVDPLAAVTTILDGHRQAARAEPERLTVPVPPVPDPGPARAVWWFAAALVGTAALAGGLAALVSRARRRGWRPGGGNPTFAGVRSP